MACTRRQKFFPTRILQRSVVQHLLGQELLQAPVLISNAFSFLASDTSMPPNFAFHL